MFSFSMNNNFCLGFGLDFHLEKSDYFQFHTFTLVMGEKSNKITFFFNGVSIAQRSTRQAYLILVCRVNLEHLFSRI